MTTKQKYTTLIKSEAKRLGFISCGISKSQFLEKEAPRLEKWLNKELLFLIEDFLSEKVIKTFNYVDYSYVKKLKEDFLKNKQSYLYNRLWLLIVLHKWLIKNEA